MGMCQRADRVSRPSGGLTERTKLERLCEFEPGLCNDENL